MLMSVPFRRPPWRLVPALPLSALLLIGCGAEREPPKAPSVADLPTLTAVATADVEGGPDVGNVILLVGPGGRVLFNPDDRRAFGLIAMLRPGQKTPTRVGGIGNGPGELSFPLPLGFADSTLFVYDAIAALVTEWDDAGQQIRDFPRIGGVRPVVVVPGRGIVAVRDRAAGVDVYVVDPESGTQRLLVPLTDPTLRAIFPDAPDMPRARKPRYVVSAWADGIILGNGATYQMAIYDWNGRLVGTPRRDLPPNPRTLAELEGFMDILHRGQVLRSAADSLRLRSQFAVASKEWFLPLNPPRVDGRGRLWVVGDLGDVAAADLFEGDRFIGRMPIPCPEFDGRWGLHGDMLVLQCATEDPASVRSVALRWFRIVEKDSIRR